jgi:hypothetical protein
MWISLFTYFSDFCDFSVFPISEKIGVFALLHTLSKVPPYGIPEPSMIRCPLSEPTGLEIALALATGMSA